MFEIVLQGFLQALEYQRLEDIVEDTTMECFAQGLYLLGGGYQYHINTAVSGAQLAQQIKAGTGWEMYIQQQQFGLQNINQVFGVFQTMGEANQFEALNAL